MKKEETAKGNSRGSEERGGRREEKGEPKRKRREGGKGIRNRRNMRKKRKKRRERERKEKQKRKNREGTWMRTKRIYNKTGKKINETRE